MSVVKMVPVKSSNLKAIGWVEKDINDTTRVHANHIRIEFQRGASYDYFPVTKEDYNLGISCNNVSNWFNIFKVGKQFIKL